MTNYSLPKISENRASLFDHCALALDRSLRTGAHGLPLMGTGDWNDGMDMVGAGGKGESVWLGWFLHSAIAAFSNLAERRGNTEHAQEWRQHATDLKASLEREAWDGDWYPGPSSTTARRSGPFPTTNAASTPSLSPGR